MSMTIALNSDDLIVTVQDVERGLACECRCIECGEALIARRGGRRLHHFSHISQKEPCEVQPESFVHRYAKQVLMESLGMQLPPFPGHNPEAIDVTSWWDFESIKEEVWMGDFRPDLVAQLSDGPLLIEVACTSFVDEEKQVRIERAGIRTVEIDLSRVVMHPSSEGLVKLKRSILHDASLKRWAYPKAPVVSPFSDALPIPFCPSPLSNTRVPAQSEATRFVMQGMWVDLRVLAHGSIVIRSVAYSPKIVELLKALAGRYGGHYVAKYRNWMFPSWTKSAVEQELKLLADDHSFYRPLNGNTKTFLGALEPKNKPGSEAYLDAALVFQQYRLGEAPGCLPIGEFKIRHYGIEVDHEPLERCLRCSGVEILGVEIIQTHEQTELAYRVVRQKLVRL